MSDLVTIYIVTRNRCELLKRAVSSVFDQTYANWELLVVDDNSVDGTQEVVVELQKSGPIRYFRNENRRGACFSRNVALRHAQGRLITGMDDDDYFALTRVADLVEAYRDTYSLVCANIVELTPTRRVKRKYSYEQGVFGLNRLLYQNLVGNQMLTSVEKLRSINGFDENLPAFQDYDTWVRLVEKYGTGLKIAKYNYFLNRSDDSERISNSSQRKTKGFEMFYAKHSKLMSKGHKKAMDIVYHKVSGKRLTFFALVRLLTLSNYKQGISVFLKQRKLRG